MTVAQDRARDRYLRKTYGITLVEYDLVLASQGGVCALCGKPPKARRLHVDHNHRTGAERGLLCFFCNSERLGRGKEDPEMHIKIADYLRHGAERVAVIRAQA